MGDAIRTRVVLACLSMAEATAVAGISVANGCEDNFSPYAVLDFSTPMDDEIVYSVSLALEKGPARFFHKIHDVVATTMLGIAVSKIPERSMEWKVVVLLRYFSDALRQCIAKYPHLLELLRT